VVEGRQKEGRKERRKRVGRKEGRKRGGRKEEREEEGKKKESREEGRKKERRKEGCRRTNEDGKYHRWINEMRQREGWVSRKKNQSPIGGRHCVITFQ
jgi:hypothetical protein